MSLLATHSAPKRVRDERAGAAQRSRTDLAAGAGLLLPTLVFVAANAWVSDDAYISLRTVDNFLAGYGLRWNVLERVQSFTHPLWLALLVAARAIVGKSFVAAASLGIILTAATVAVLVFALARRAGVAAVCVLAFLLSPSFVDYATSGLENPLTGFLLAAFVTVLFKGSQDEGPTAGSSVLLPCWR